MPSRQASPQTILSPHTTLSLFIPRRSLAVALCARARLLRECVSARGATHLAAAPHATLWASIVAVAPDRLLGTLKGYVQRGLDLARLLLKQLRLLQESLPRQSHLLRLGVLRTDRPSPRGARRRRRRGYAPVTGAVSERRFAAVHVCPACQSARPSSPCACPSLQPIRASSYRARPSSHRSPLVNEAHRDRLPELRVSIRSLHGIGRAGPSRLLRRRRAHWVIQQVPVSIEPVGNSWRLASGRRVRVDH